jgi:hypothetical protein
MHSPRLRNRPKRHGAEFNQTSAVARECRLQSFLTMILQTRQCPALVTPHKAGVADNDWGQDRRQFALLTGQWNFPALLQRIARGLNRHVRSTPNIGRFRTRSALRICAHKRTCLYYARMDAARTSIGCGVRFVGSSGNHFGRRHRHPRQQRADQMLTDPVLWIRSLLRTKT